MRRWPHNQLQARLYGSNAKTEHYQGAVTVAMEKFFPLIMERRKTTDCPWINVRIKINIGKREDVYRREGRSEKWEKILKKRSDNLILKCKKKYLQSQQDIPE